MRFGVLLTLHLEDISLVAHRRCRSAAFPRDFKLRPICRYRWIQRLLGRCTSSPLRGENIDPNPSGMPRKPLVSAVHIGQPQVAADKTIGARKPQGNKSPAVKPRKRRGPAMIRAVSNKGLRPMRFVVVSCIRYIGVYVTDVSLKRQLWLSSQGSSPTPQGILPAPTGGTSPSTQFADADHSLPGSPHGTLYDNTSRVGCEASEIHIDNRQSARRKPIQPCHTYACE
eukprot:IDg4084t1